MTSAIRTSVTMSTDCSAEEITEASVAHPPASQCIKGTLNMTETLVCSTQCGKSCLGPDTKKGNDKDDPPSIAQVYCRFNEEVLPEYNLPLCADLVDDYCVDKKGNAGEPLCKKMDARISTRITKMVLVVMVVKWTVVIPKS